MLCNQTGFWTYNTQFQYYLCSHTQYTFSGYLSVENEHIFFFVSLWYCVIYIIGFDNFCSRITAVVTSKGKELIVTLMNRSYQVITEGWNIDALWSPRCWAWRSWGLEAEEEKKESWATKLKNLLRLNTWMVDTLLSWKIASLREHAVGWNRRDEIIRK